ncbi:MAG TPA: PEP-CTERM sorting domain-containing protein, partial [Armatimonadota bacterium]|nr:PEP-CTERM sorting domain-containing protein [Armatimonadota bacterium]
EKYAIYDVLANGGYVGQGWFALQKLVNSPEYLHLSYQDQVDIYRQMWGHNLIGNPFIYANYTPAVPEPSSLFALLVPCAGVLFAYRRRK